MGFLQVLLLILKILGILFVSVLALILIAIVLLLFVPLRYRLEGHKAEDYAIDARASWLLRLIRVNVKYASETKLFYEVRLLWFLLLSNDEAWQAAKEEKKKKKAEKKARKAEKKKQKQKEKRAAAKAKQKAKRRKSAGKQHGLPSGTDKSVKQLPEAVQNEKEDATSKNPGSETAGLQEQNDSVNDDLAKGNGQRNEEKKNRFSRICDKIKALVDKIKQKFCAVLTTVKTLCHKADIVITFLKDDGNKAAFGACWSTLVQILKHMGPTKIQGYLAFGMDDPATTGYILAVLGIFYGKFGKSFSIRPNFEEKQFETELRAKGRIRMSRLLHLAWKLWKNKDFRSLLDNIKQLKADIKTNGG